MNESKGSVVVGGQWSADAQPKVVVVPDRGGECEYALGHAGADAGDGPSAVLFEVELALEGVVDRLDDLSEGLEEPLAGAGLLALAGRPEQGDPGGGEFGLEGLAVVVLVADQDRLMLVGPGLGLPQQGAGREDAGQHLAVVGLRAGQRPAQ